MMITGKDNITKFYIYDNSDELIETIDSVEKAFEFLSNEGSYIIKETDKLVCQFS